METLKWWRKKGRKVYKAYAAESWSIRVTQLLNFVALVIEMNIQEKTPHFATPLCLPEKTFNTQTDDITRNSSSNSRHFMAESNLRLNTLAKLRACSAYIPIRTRTWVTGKKCLLLLFCSFVLQLIKAIKYTLKHPAYFHLVHIWILIKFSRQTFWTQCVICGTEIFHSSYGTK